MDNPSLESLAAWRSKVPKGSCDCVTFLDKYTSDPKTQPRFDDWFRWTFELRNAIRTQKLKLPAWDWSLALKEWRPHLAWGQQPEIEDFVAVTSLAPHRFERQSVVLDSWKRFGLKIVSVNTYEECQTIKNDYPQVSGWVHCESDRKTPRINSLLDISTNWGVPVLVINSDIEIHGDQARLIDLIKSRKSAIGVRHNYDSHPGESNQEMWGLDAFLVYPEQVLLIHRTDFAIGVPMWDWWLPWELNRIRAKCDWIEEPFFFHKNHQQAWSIETCEQQKAYFADRFGFVEFIKWRQERRFED